MTLPTKAKLSALLADCEASNRRLIAERDALQAWKAAVPVAALEHYWTHSDWIIGSVDREQENAGDAVIAAWIDTLPQPEAQP